MKLPLDHIKKSELFRHSWDSLESLLRGNHIQNISLVTDTIDLVPHWILTESFGDFSFKMIRNKSTNQRITQLDKTGIIGLSSCNFKEPLVIITEGVSDFITTKLLYPHRNVIGLTTLSGTSLSKYIITSLFKNIVLITDNDPQSHTGLLNAQKMLHYYTSRGKNVKIQMPKYGHKDITDQFLFELRHKQENDG